MMRRLCLLLLFVAGVAVADERILRYHSDILVRTDGSMEVTETIQVRAEGSQIRRGIYRDYPTDYEDSLGNDVQVIYEPRWVTRNGDAESFFSEEVANGVRTYFGSSDRFLSPGVYTYEYRYDADRMLGFFEEYDELWWNVTGNGWNFPIDDASATIRFEFDVSPGDVRQSAWQGAFGSTEEASTSSDGEYRYASTRSLGVGEGLSVSIGFPKGLVAEPSDLQRLIWLLSDNLNLLVALAGLAAMLAYYIPVWNNYGRDPAPGVVFTRYEPPDGFSPASLRYIHNMSYDNKTMTAGIVSLAVKGFLRIDEDDDEHTLTRTDPGADAAPLASGEKALLDALFDEGNSIELVNDNHETLGAAKSAHEASLRRDYHNRYFVTNGMLNLPPLLIGVLATVVALVIGPSFLVVASIVAMVGVLLLFFVLLMRPTKLGRALLDEALGFEEYLEFAEKDEMNLRNPPEKTPELFERYLPYALALGVQQEWAERFARIFAELKGPTDTAWQPSWYGGSWNNFDLGSTTQSLSSSLGTSISSSVSPPGSSSGGGGGGFSGGGGGGGGGGGW